RPEELKKLEQVTPGGTRRYEVDVPSPAEKLSLLRKVQGVLDATLFGQAIHLLVREDLNEDAIRRQLGTERVEIRPIEPSLEDVFVTLTRNAAAEAPQTRAPTGSPPRRGGRSAEQPRALAGLRAILTKEFFHLRRQPT